MNIFFLILIGLSLSMDTFSLSLSLGMLYPNKKDELVYSILVGGLHFIMPLLGNMLRITLNKYFSIASDTLLIVIFIFIIIMMISDLIKKENKIYKLNLINMLIYSISVSIDSFSVGIIMQNITTIPLLGYLIFMILAFSFTYLGMIVSKYIYNKYSNYSKIIGIIIMIVLTTIHLIT